MPFILNEDAALKAKLTGITVADAKNSARPVGVWFGQPDLEIREQSYPYLTIEMIDISEDTARAHRGYIPLPYTPEGFATGTVVYSDYPIPVDIYYQVSSYSRNPRHDRQIISAILKNKLPMRFNYLEIPQDKTVRPVDLLGYTKRDTAEENKRLFVNIFSIKVASEILPEKLTSAISAVASVNITSKIIPR
jgi:hypothetical protein